MIVYHPEQFDVLDVCVVNQIHRVWVAVAVGYGDILRHHLGRPTDVVLSRLETNFLECHDL